MKDRWDKAETVSKILSSLVLVVIALVINTTIQKQQVRLDYARFASEVLAKPVGNSRSDSLLYDWAVNFIINNQARFPAVLHSVEFGKLDSTYMILLLDSVRIQTPGTPLRK